MEIKFQKLASLLIDLETVNEERLADLSRQLKDLHTFERRVVKQLEHLKLKKVRGCILVDSPTMDIRIRAYMPRILDLNNNDISDVDELYACIHNMTKFYSSHNPDHVSLVETHDRIAYVPLEEIKL